MSLLHSSLEKYRQTDRLEGPWHPEDYLLQGNTNRFYTRFYKINEENPDFQQMESEFVLWGFCFCFVLEPELKFLLYC